MRMALMVGSVALALLGGGVAVAQGRRGAAPALAVPSVKLVYKKVAGTELELWVWRPADWRAADRRAAMLFFHGGGWRNGSPSAFSRQAAKLAGQGMVAISASYRLTATPGVTVAECVKDARSAMRWVRSHAGELGVDPAKIGAGGGSAGGHLAASLVTLDEINEPGDDLGVSTKPAALVLFNPALVLGGARAARFGTTEQVASVSPFHHLKPGMAHPPTLILHGEEDTTVPIESVRRYAAKVKELGGECEVVGYPGQQHSFFNRPPMLEETQARMEVFLKAKGLLQAPVRAPEE